MNRQDRSAAHGSLHAANDAWLIEASDHDRKITARWIEEFQRRKRITLAPILVFEIADHFQRDHCTKRDSLFLERTGMDGASRVCGARAAAKKWRLFQRIGNQLHSHGQ